MEKLQLRHGSLFSGIGGFDLAATWVGWRNIFHCELNPFCRQILNYYYPEAKSYENIKTTDFSVQKGKIDILTGGFPCQPYSLAGKRLGTDDSRHLWPDMLRAIREIRPPWVVAENVPGIISWNEGLVFEEVQTDLEAEGYQVQPFVLPAAGVGAPHRRERVWFIAYAERYDNIRKKRRGDGQKESLEGKYGTQNCAAGMPGRTNYHDTQGDEPHQHDVANTNSDERSERRRHPDRSQKTERDIIQFDPWNYRDPWKDFPTQPPVCDGDDGLSLQLDGIAFSRWRTQSIMAGGNAIVPQVAYQIFLAINESYQMY